MTRTTIFRSDRMAIAMVGALLAPTFAFSQDSTVTSRTHLVRKGDTLWSIAREYTSDPYRWKQVYELNTATVRDPHWIYPGERLVLPGVVRSPTLPPHRRRSRSRSPVSAEPAAEPMAQPTVELAQRAAERVVRCTDGVPSSIERSAALHCADLVAGGADTSARGCTDHPCRRVLRRALRREYRRSAERRPHRRHRRSPGHSADRERAPAAVERADLHHGPARHVIRAWRAVRRRCAVDRCSRALARSSFRQPSSWWTVRSPGRPLRRESLRDTTQSRSATSSSSWRRRRPEPSAPTAQANGARTSVLWTLGEPVLPSLQSYVVVAGGTASGMRVGDQITFYRERRATVDGVTLPESDIGIAQIVRVTAQATTALVIDQSYAAIGAGTAARVSAKMP